MKSFMRAGGALSDRGFRHAPFSRFRRCAGLTLVEMAVAMGALSLLSTLLLTSTKACLRGSDRAACILNIETVQKGVRGFASMSGLKPGAVVSGLEAEVVGSGRFFDQLPACPGHGSYTLGGDRIPEIGVLYMNCSLGTSLDHLPDEFDGW